MPWKGEKNPYRIWLSEIILQQTQVVRGAVYYERFLERFPTVADLAEASIDEVMKYWEGLGYYSRARNLHHTARVITADYNGIFPADYALLLNLKGIGPYTAAAIASFAFNIPKAVVDGNVYRVLARYFGIGEPIDTTAGKKLFFDLADRCLDRSEPGAYNQAIIDFGATQCKPRNPDCYRCALHSGCKAFDSDLVESLPLKSKKQIRKNREFNFFYIRHGGGLLIRRREEADIWRNLYEFPLIETEKTSDWQELNALAAEKGWWQDGNVVLLGSAGPYTRVLTHQHIRARFWILHLTDSGSSLLQNYQKVPPEQIRLFAFPKVIHCFFEDKTIHLKIF